MRAAAAASKAAGKEKSRRKGGGGGAGGGGGEQLLTDQVLSLRARLHLALALGLAKYNFLLSDNYLLFSSRRLAVGSRTRH
jgi:hypothetical protein